MFRVGGVGDLGDQWLLSAAHCPHSCRFWTLLVAPRPPAPTLQVPRVAGALCVVTHCPSTCFAFPEPASNILKSFTLPHSLSEADMNKGGGLLL